MISEKLIVRALCFINSLMGRHLNIENLFVKWSILPYKLFADIEESNINQKKEKNATKLIRR